MSWYKDTIRKTDNILLISFFQFHVQSSWKRLPFESWNRILNLGVWGKASWQRKSPSFSQLHFETYKYFQVTVKIWKFSLWSSLSKTLNKKFWIVLSLVKKRHSQVPSSQKFEVDLVESRSLQIFRNLELVTWNLGMSVFDQFLVEPKLLI